MIILTNHAKERAIGRYFIDEESLIGLCLKAISEGFSVNDAPHRKLRKFLEKKVKKGCVPYCYNGYVFIVKALKDSLLLITTFRLPEAYFRYL